MKIGQLAQATGTTVEAIRFYEREGLLAHTPRTDGNYRVYDSAHAEQLAFIRNSRKLDMPLAEIRTLLQFKDAPTGNCGDVNRLLDAHIGRVALRLHELKALEKSLKALRTQCLDVSASKDCGILQGLYARASKSTKGLSTPCLPRGRNDLSNHSTAGRITATSPTLKGTP